MRYLFRSTLLALLSFGGAAIAGAQTHTDVIRGAVKSDSGTVIGGVDVIVTMAPSAVTFRSKSDAAGKFNIAIHDGSGEYLLYASLPGRRAYRLRLTRTGRDSTFDVTATLGTIIAFIAPMRVNTTYPRPARPNPNNIDFNAYTGADKVFDGVDAALPPDMIGNLSAMAGLIPGLSVTGDGISAFGLGTDNNSSTLNGLNFSGDVPRDMQTVTRFSFSPWDPAIGGFSGVNINTTLARGDNFTIRRGHATLDASALQFSDDVARRTGQEFDDLTLGLGGTGAFVLDESFYNFGIQASRRTAPAVSLLDLDRDALARSGVSADSADKLIHVLNTLRVPLSAGGNASQTVSTGIKGGFQYDRVSPRPVGDAAPGPTWSSSATGSYSESESGLAPTSAPSTNSKSSSAQIAVQSAYSKYLGAKGDILNDTKTGLTYVESRGMPYLQLPSGSVLVSSTLDDGSPALGSLNFGGNSPLTSDSKRWNWQLSNETNFLAGKHISLPMKIFLQSQYEGYNQSVGANRLGSFSFNSLSALAANTPTAFSRALNVPVRNGGEWNGSAAFSGRYITPRWTWTGGARVDANVFTSAPAENPQVASLFGANTDHAPNTAGVSPRLGFIWRYTGRPGGRITSNGLSTIGQGGPQVHGGIGSFRSSLPSTLLSDPSAYTGLPGGTQQLYCVGAAAPAPDWQGYEHNLSSIPTDCVGTSAFADTTARVRLYDRNFKPVDSWHANLGWVRTFHDVYIALDATYALNLNVASNLDLNFTGVPQFTLASEGNRPVYVPTSNIAATTGALSPAGTRLSSLFGTVNDRLSDLRGHSLLLQAYFVPNIPFKYGAYTLSYAFSAGSSQVRGFDGNTGGDPRAIEWAPASAPLHRFTIQGARYFFKRWGVSLATTIASGFRYTPVVAGDINGDGSSNDRAFVFNPATLSDPVLAAGLHSLMTNGATSARSCLSGQIGQVAAQNSCTGPWSATMNAGLSYEPKYTNGVTRVTFSANFANVLAGADLLLHGANHLSGWGMPAYPDSRLYQVEGFDAANHRFLYQLNPRFGSTSPVNQLLRSPFRVTIIASFDFSHNPQLQFLEQSMRLRPALIGTRAPADSIRARYSRNRGNLFLSLLGLADSLALSRNQIDSLQAEQLLYDARLDVIYAALGVDLAKLPDNYDEDAGVRRVNDAGKEADKMREEENKFFRQLFTDGQIRLLSKTMQQEILKIPK